MTKCSHNVFTETWGLCSWHYVTHIIKESPNFFNPVFPVLNYIIFLSWGVQAATVVNPDLQLTLVLLFLSYMNLTSEELSSFFFFSIFPACPRCASNLGGQPSAPGLQTTGSHRAGTGVRREERHDLLWGEPPVQLQRHRVLHRAVSHRSHEARHGEVLETKQRWDSLTWCGNELLDLNTCF